MFGVLFSPIDTSDLDWGPVEYNSNNSSILNCSFSCLAYTINRPLIEQNKLLFFFAEQSAQFSPVKSLMFCTL